MNPSNVKKAAIAVAVTIGVGGAVAIDETQQVIPLACDIQTEVVADLETKLKTYKIDEGFIDTRDMTAKDKATIKGCEVVKKLEKANIKTKNRNAIDIEIVEANPIENGVEVYARVWTKSELDVYISTTTAEGLQENIYSHTVPANTQIGFGENGTVDIERFRVFNPPVLVEDPNGKIVRVSPGNSDLGVPTTTTTYREDPEEAILQVIEHNITVMQNVHDDSKIVRGKRGRTTTTVYPDPHPETSSVDGRFLAYSVSGNETWDYVHDKTSANDAADAASDNDASTLLWYVRYRSGGAAYTLNRSIFLFDTSAIGSDTITSATLSIYGTSKADGSYTSNDGDTVLVSSNPASDTAIAAGDYDQVGDALDNPTEGANRITYASWSTSGYNDFTLNASGLSWVNGSGISKFGIRSDFDAEDTAPSPQTAAGEFVQGYYADQTGTANDPKLVVEHSAGARRIIKTTNPF